MQPRFKLVSCTPRGVLFMAASMWLAGCAVGPDYRTPALSLPEQWGSAAQAEASGAPALSRWWQSLNDPQLSALIDAAVAGNLDVATAKAKIREARASYRQTVGALGPSISGSGSATRNKNADTTSAAGGASVTGTYEQYQAGFDASWEIDLFGANRRSAEAARYGLDAAQEELRATLLTLIGDVASNYVEARGLQARIELARRTATSHRETAVLTQTKYELGAVSGVDRANAAGQASATEASIPELQASYAETVHRLGVLTGQAPSALTEQLQTSASIPAPSLPVATGIPADVLLARPDVRLAERQLAQATANIGQAQAARFPSISLTGSIATTALQSGDLGKSSTISWSFGPTLSVPLFNAGQLSAAVEVARAQRDQYFLAYRSAVLSALEDVENTIVSLAQERIRNTDLASSVDSYREAARLTRLLYENGRSSFLEVLDAERSLYSAEDSLIQSRVAITTDYIALNKSLGGGWDGEVDAGTSEEP